MVEHGGLHGTPDEGALDSTIARPRNLFAYEPDSSIYELAASYGFGFARNHCFPDGNKRLALVAMDVFLMANGYELVASEPEAVVTMRALAPDELTEPGLAKWVEQSSALLKQEP